MAIMAQAGGSGGKAWMAIVVVGILISSLEVSAFEDTMSTGPPRTSGGLVRDSNPPSFRLLAESLGIVSSIQGESSLARNGFASNGIMAAAAPPTNLPSPAGPSTGAPPTGAPPTSSDPPQDPDSSGSDSSGTKASSTDRNDNGGSSLSSGAKAGIAIGVILGALVFAGAFFILRTRRNNVRRAGGSYTDPFIGQTL